MRLILLIITLSLPYSGFSQEDSKQSAPKIHKNSFYINPFSGFARTLNVSYERFLNQRFSASIGYLSGSIYPDGVEKKAENHFTQRGITIATRWYTRTYPSKTSEDFYFGPYFRYLNDELQDYDFKESGFVRDSVGDFVQRSESFSIWKIGGLIGSRQIYFKRLAIDAFAGIHYQVPSKNLLTSDELINRMAHKGVSFRVGIQAGFVF